MKKRPLIIVLYFLITISYCYSSNWTTYTTGNSNLPSNEIRAVCIDNNGVKWFGTDKGLVRFDGFDWKTILPSSNQQTLAHSSILDLFTCASSYGLELWIGTEGGVSAMEISTDAITMATPYKHENTELISNYVRTVFVDNQHIKWFGTDLGISALFNKTWKTFTAYDGYLAHDFTLSSGADAMGNRYFGSYGAGVSRLLGDDIDGITAASPYQEEWCALAADTIYDLFIEENNIQWFGTSQGVSRHDQTSSDYGWTNYRIKDGLVDNHVLALLKDNRNTMWFGTRKGISLFNGTSWSSFTVQDSLAGNHVNAMAIDLDGSIWIATNSGISHYSGELAQVETPNSTIMQAQQFQLFQNYPNPFNPATTIRFNLIEASRVKLIIFNMAGQSVATLVDAGLTPGEYSMKWIAEDMPAGIYFCRMQAGKFQLVKKMILQK